MFLIGFGFDSHKFEEDKPLYLGGVYIPYKRGLKGHSDGDALIHAITDAILSALGEPDIGELFPDTDPRWRGVSSLLFLEEAMKRMKNKNYTISNLDCTVVTNEPKIKDYKTQIREKLSNLLGVDYSRVNVKGKTKEGFCESEGLVCYCVVLLKHEG